MDSTLYRKRGKLRPLKLLYGSKKKNALKEAAAIDTAIYKERGQTTPAQTTFTALKRRTHLRRRPQLTLLSIEKEANYARSNYFSGSKKHQLFKNLTTFSQKTRRFFCSLFSPFHLEALQTAYITSFLPLCTLFCITNEKTGMYSKNQKRNTMSSYCKYRATFLLSTYYYIYAFENKAVHITKYCSDRGGTIHRPLCAISACI